MVGLEVILEVPIKPRAPSLFWISFIFFFCSIMILSMIGEVRWTLCFRWQTETWSRWFVFSPLIQYIFASTTVKVSTHFRQWFESSSGFSCREKREILRSFRLFTQYMNQFLLNNDSLSIPVKSRSNSNESSFHSCDSANWKMVILSELTNTSFIIQVALILGEPGSLLANTDKGLVTIPGKLLTEYKRVYGLLTSAIIVWRTYFQAQ